MLGTYAAALLVIGASVPVGTVVLALAGRREFSWLAPVLGLAVITALAWLLVRLPGEGLTALLGIVAVAAVCGVASLPRLRPPREELVRGGVTAALALLAVSIPFAVEGHFGILGTGFNVDMSQHLFTAEWIAMPLGPAPPLIDQGYPVGPHALAVAAAELTGGNLVTAFSGVTIAVPVIGALTALAGLRTLRPAARPPAAALVALPYLVASYLAQGAFKELFEAVFLLGLAIWLLELRRAESPRPGFALPAAALLVGALYAYSGPGAAWLAGTVAIWLALELLLDRERLLGAARTGLAGIALAAVVAGVALAPELGRIAEFGGSAGSVANAGDREPRAAGPVEIGVQRGASDATEAPGAPGIGAEAAESGLPEEEPGREDRRLDLFNNDLGNLFGDVPPLEMLGVWPTGDFRVEPGDGAVPAPVYYLGALLGLAALALGVRLAIRRRETALLAALAAALGIWLAAWALSTPYTTAKALQMVAPVLILISVRGVLDPGFLAGADARRDGRPRTLATAALALAFSVAAAGSSVLALANAPVGPERYTAGIGKLRERLTGEPLLLLAPSGQLDDRHGAEFYGWELRGGRPICVEPFPEQGTGFDRPVPAGIRYVITLGGKSAAPFEDVEQVARRRRVALWEATGFDPARAPLIELDPDVPTDCELGLE